MKQVNFSAINLWCSKNMVDTQYTIWEILKLNSNKFEINFFTNPEDEEVEYIIINTCWFLSSSREEAEDTISYYDNLWKKIIIIWCYIPVKNDNFLSNLKNLEAVVPYWEAKNTSSILLKNDNLSKIKESLFKLKKEKLKKYLSQIWWDQIKNKAHIYWTESVRAFLNTNKWYEYLKIAEWCNNKCRFCIIPNIRWKQRSRSIEDILEEVNIMIKNWIKEIEIISQDTTRYWIDLYKAPKLLELLEKIEKIDWDFKIRLFYMYPDILSFSHLDRLAKLKKLLPYFDFPFQHISPNILKNMNRFYDEKHIYKLIDYIKNKFKNPFFHTNFIIWFPWETEKDFKELLNFIKKYEFESISIFWYHDEKLADSSKLTNKVDDNIIEKRIKKLKKVLEKIYTKKEKERYWKEQIWYIEEIQEEYIIIRPEIKAPDIDDYDKIKIKSLKFKILNIWDKITYFL